MGKTRGLYNAEFPRGSWVRIVDRRALERFAITWEYHHPLERAQFEFAGTVSRVGDVGYYHGGAEIYALEKVPGVWHEVCLVKARQPHTEPKPPPKPRRATKPRARVKHKPKAVTKPAASRKRRAARRRKARR